MDCLLNDGCRVLLETNGSLSIEKVDKRVVKIMDLKCPGSGMSDHMAFSNIARLRPEDEVKFVISDARDFDWAVRIIRDYNLVQRCNLLISPVQPGLKPSAAADWILREKLPLRLQLQLHKLIWPEKDPGGDRGY
jgi:7-carboxy-7-deazaguanine synthase